MRGVQGLSVQGFSYLRRKLSGDNFPRCKLSGGQLSGGEIISGAAVLVRSCPGKNCPGAIVLRGNYLGGNCLRAIFQGGIVLFSCSGTPETLITKKYDLF